MMKTLYLTFCILAMQTIASAQNLVWAKHLSGTSSCEIENSVLAPNGDLLSTGTFTGTFDFDPGAGVSELTSVGFSNQFVMRTDADGNFIWVMQFGGGVFQENMQVASDEEDNIYVAGTFSESFDSDPSAGINILTPNGPSSVFVAKYNADRELIWVNKIDNSDFTELNSLLVNGSGGAYVSGIFKNALSINDTEDVNDLGDTRRSFLVKFDASSGIFEWSGYQSPNAIINDLTFNNAGQVIAVGEFFFICDADFDETAEFELNANASRDVFITVYNPDRTLVNALSFGASGYDAAHRVGVDSEGNVIVVGQYFTQVNPDPAGSGPAQLTTAGFTDGCFIAKYTADLDFIWAKQLGKAADTFIFDLAIGPDNHIYTTGTFNGTANMDPAQPEINETLTSEGDGDGFLSRLDADGNYVYGGQFRGPHYEESPVSIVFDENGSFYITGYFFTSIDVDPSNDVVEIISEGGINSFILKFNDLPLSASASAAINDMSVFPNPSAGEFMLQSARGISDVQVLVYNMNGQSIPFQKQQTGDRFSINLDAPSGVYQVLINYSDGTATNHKIVITNR